MTHVKMFRALFFVSLLVVGFFTLDPSPPSLGLENVNDKLEHFVAFGGLAGLARLGFRKAADLALLEHVSFLGAMIEVIQASPQVQRDCDWKDWVADTAGAATALLVLYAWRRFCASRQQTLTGVVSEA